MKPDLDAIRARYLGEDTLAPPGAVLDVETLLAYIDDIEHERDGWKFNALDARDQIAILEGKHPVPAELWPRITYVVGQEETANRIAHAEARFVEEYDAHQKTRRLLTDLFYKQLKADAEQMRAYGIGQVGVRNLLVDFQNEELSLGKVVDLLRAAAREMAKEQVEELKARIVTLEAMKT